MEARYRRPDEPICAGRPQSPVVDRRWQRLTRQPRTCWGAAHPRERAREFFDESPPGTCALPVSSGDSLKKSLAPYTHSRSTTAGRTADEPGEATTPRPGVLTHRGSRNSEEWGRSPGSVHEPQAPRPTRRFRTLDTNHGHRDLHVASVRSTRTTGIATYTSLPCARHEPQAWRPTRRFRTLDTNHRHRDLHVASVRSTRTTGTATYETLPPTRHEPQAPRPRRRFRTLDTEGEAGDLGSVSKDPAARRPMPTRAPMGARIWPAAMVCPR